MLHEKPYVLRLAYAQKHAVPEEVVQPVRAEVRQLLEGGMRRDSNAFQAIGYREVADWVAGRATRSETEERIVTATRQLAKKQRTWFARERDVEWITPDRALGVALDRLDEGDTERSG